MKHKYGSSGSISTFMLFTAIFAFCANASGQAGTLDNSFSQDGKVVTKVGTFNDIATGVAIQSDGKAVLVGNGTNGSSVDFAVIRYKTDGTLDSTFAGDGIAFITISSGVDEAKAIAIQSDGKIVIAGYADNTVSGNQDFAVARLKTDGTLDSTFSGDGMVMTAVGTKDDAASCLAIQSNGKIFVGGYSIVGVNARFALVKYNSDGSPDNTFSGDGMVTQNINTADWAHAVAVQSDGKIVLGGGSNSDFTLVRFRTDGTLDTSFSSDGIVSTNFFTLSDDDLNALIILGDGSIVAAGYSDSGNGFMMAIAKYQSNGALDNSFSSDGKVTVQIGSDDNALGMAQLYNGKFGVCGYSFDGSQYNFSIVVLNSNGSFDNNFSGDGQATFSLGTISDAANAMAMQSDGNIVLVGSSENNSDLDFAAIRLKGFTNSVFDFQQPKYSTKVFPNPGKGLIHFEINHPDKKMLNGEIIIYDLNGKKVCSQTMESGGIMLTRELNPGIYFFEIVNKNAQVISCGRFMAE